MLPYRDSTFARIAFGIFFLVVILYAYFEARGLVYGPRITVPSETMIVQDPFIEITGKAERIATLAMNGKIIPVTEEGVFAEAYLLAPGYNRIALRAEDKYGRSKERFIEILYVPAPIPEELATTTTAAVAPE
ncbi:MAG: hypothetical protein UY63_C0017G0022 [Parcubacteria group bacterium GW2011_GWA2_51_10]|nr:MAG: hypothetical protein UY63_C0017G0022 [Parcubacteria group bacterium GW2011_GWA2_51_10]